MREAGLAGPDDQSTRVGAVEEDKDTQAVTATEQWASPEVRALAEQWGAFWMCEA